MSTIEKIVKEGYCVGCGGCAYVSNSQMEINEYGEYVPEVNVLKITNEKLEKVCPSLSPDLNEDMLACDLFSSDNKYDETLGYYKKTFAAYIKEGNFRKKGTSGGTTTWIVTELLRNNLIDGVIHVKENIREDISDPFYKYGLSHTENEIRLAAKTRYHVVEMNEVLSLIKDSNKRYAFIGVPCMIKTIRRLQLIEPQLKTKIPFTISLVCGHLKSINWSLSLGWGAGVHPKNSAKIQYRTKGKDIPARAYVFRVEDKDKNIIQKDSALVAGGKFNAGALMLKACEFCDDVIGETSDLTVGDAWLPRFEADDNGTNLLVVRNEQILHLLREGEKKNNIELIDISVEEAINSQNGGYKQRREGLSYRLEREIKINRWVPTKRIKPSQFNLSTNRKRIYDDRTKVTNVSRELFKNALQEDNYEIYNKEVSKITKQLRKNEIMSSLPRLLLNKLQRIFLKLVKRK